MSETTGQRLKREIEVRFNEHNPMQYEELFARVDAIMGVERQERIDATARALFTRKIEPCPYVPESADDALADTLNSKHRVWIEEVAWRCYQAADRLEFARSRFLAAQEKP